MQPVLKTCLLLMLLQSGSAAWAQSVAPGYGSLGYQLPAVGSYRLPPLGRAADGEVLTSEGQKKRLHQLFGKQYVLLAFIYSSCNDVNGCPLTGHVLSRIRARMKEDPQLARHLRLISLSFDPEVDTPEVMRRYGENFRFGAQAGEWLFLTTASERQLAPLLAAYGQDIQKQVTDGGRNTSRFSHVLRVFLIDPQKQIRNIYSVAFLHEALIINDFKTLLLEAHQQPTAEPSAAPQLSVPGDYKKGYEQASYQTRSRALDHRQGKKADLFALAGRPPLGLPAVPVPQDNPLTGEKIELGRTLFFDRRLSLNNTFSCAMCHVPEQGFSSNELATAVGIEGRSVRRNSPTLYNVAYATLLFHDGRETRLEQQIWGPLLARNEMGNPSVGQVLDKIRRLDNYEELFETAFPGRGVSMETLGMALASYQRILISGDSPFDRWYYGGDANALSPSARRGFDIFSGKGGCSACHLVGKESALFSDNRLHNTGIGYRESMGIRPQTEPVVLAPGVVIEVDRAIIDQVSETPAADVGLYEVTLNPDDRWKYKTPSLRNLTLTPPYMHNGSLSSLEEVIEFYDRGGVPNPLLDPLIRPLNLDQREKQDLLAFLRSLTGSNVDTLVADAFAAPIGDTGRNRLHPPQ